MESFRRFNAPRGGSTRVLSSQLLCYLERGLKDSRRLLKPPGVSMNRVVFLAMTTEARSDSAYSKEFGSGAEERRAGPRGSQSTTLLIRPGRSIYPNRTFLKQYVAANTNQFQVCTEHESIRFFLARSRTHSPPKSRTQC